MVYGLYIGHSHNKEWKFISFVKEFVYKNTCFNFDVKTKNEACNRL